MSSEDVTIHRKFVHDISNHLTVAECGIMKVMKLLDGKDLSNDDEYKELENIQKHIKSVVTNIKEYRQELHFLAGENKS